MSTFQAYDLAIVGAGMIGSAAARHAARSGARVALIGPVERPREQWSAEQQVMGAHYDEGRIARKTDPDPAWARVAARSIERYAEISAESGGVEFFREVGHLTVASAAQRATLDARRAAAAALGVEIEEFGDAAALGARFPQLRFPPEENVAGVFEPTESGYVSARALVAAQREAARRHGATLVDREAASVERRGADDGDAEPEFVVRLAAADGGAREDAVRAARVLVAAGAFTNLRPLVPAGAAGAPVALELAPTTAQTMHFVLGAADAARLAELPSVIYKGDAGWCYALPPIAYPDGTTRLKLGGARAYPGNAALAATGGAIGAWYRGGGDAAAHAAMAEMLRALVPGVSPLGGARADTCATCHTPTNRAYVGLVAPRLAVATGGCGYAAKSSDELGRLGAAAALADVERDARARAALARDLAPFTPRVAAPPRDDGAAAADDDDDEDDGSLLARSWSDVAAEYERLLVPRFAPWTDSALAALFARALELPPRGAVLVPCCGPGHELARLGALLPGRRIVGVDLAAGMVRRARRAAATSAARVTAHVGDAATPPPPPPAADGAGEGYAAILSVFGLQQLPAPADAISRWCGVLRPGGVAVVVFWPPGATATEQEPGPWATFARLASEAAAAADAAALKPAPPSWDAPGALAAAARAAGAEVMDDADERHEIAWNSAGACFDAMSRAGPWHAARLRRGDAFVDALREDFIAALGSGPLLHAPRARVLTLRKLAVDVGSESASCSE